MTHDVVIVGGGPAGLTAAAALAPHLKKDGVLVVEREAAAGGIPRHSDHPGYGIRDMHRFMSGPSYARRLADTARRAGVQIRTRATVTSFDADGTLQVTRPEGREQVRGRVVVLATGARERPRPARMVAGDRPAGVLTTGQLQNLVHLHHQTPGTRAVIVGSELVSWSAAMTLREAGCRPILMTTSGPRPAAHHPLAALGRLALRLPVHTRTKIARVIGEGRVSAVELEHLDTGARHTVSCDAVVFTADWIPDHELAHSAGAELDPGTRGPVVDTSQASSLPGVFAIGNLTHPVAAADVAALDGRAVAPAVLAYLAGGYRDGAGSGPRVLPGANLDWLSPGRLGPTAAPPRDRFLAWPSCHIPFPTITVAQCGVILSRRTLGWPVTPGQVMGIPASLLRPALGSEDPVTVDLHPRGGSRRARP